MGSRLFGNSSSLLGGRSFSDAGDRADVATILGIDVARIPDRPGLAYDQIVDDIADGRIKALWVVGTNPSHSWVHQRRFVDVLDRLEFLVVQDMYSTTETAQRAHLVLPAAGWAEKDGTFINSERRNGLVKRVETAPGSALADFSIFKLVAEEWGCGDMFRAWHSPEATFQILKRICDDRPCDISGIDGYEFIDRRGGVQWPFPTAAPDPDPERRLFADGVFFHDDGRARLIFEDPRPSIDSATEDFPLRLLTGRGSSSQWHTQTRTGKSAVLRSLASEDAYVELSPIDAAARSIQARDWVVVSSARGSMHARAVVTPTVGDGNVDVPMHYATTNQLTISEFDPYSRQPSYKAGAVQLRRAHAPRR